jgi:hypothetical protein
MKSRRIDGTLMRTSSMAAALFLQTIADGTDAAHMAGASSSSIVSTLH